jgi:diacylglycerol kinase family enzyme
MERHLQKSGWESEIHVAGNWEDYTHAVVQAIRQRPYALIVFGGDGSVRMAASRVARAKGLLGIVPCGRFNNIFRSLYGHTDAETAIALVTSEHQIRIDAALANGQFFVGSLVSGLLPEMIQQLGSKKLPRLSMTWSKLAAHAADDTMPRTTTLKVDSYTFKIQPMVLNVHLLSHFMSLRFAPAAVPDDGRVILIYDRDGTRDAVVHYIRDLKKDRYQYTDGLQILRGKRISISLAAGQQWLLDGDRIEFSGEEIRIEVLHRILRVFSNAPEK